MRRTQKGPGPRLANIGCIWATSDRFRERAPNVTYNDVSSIRGHETLVATERNAHAEPKCFKNRAEIISFPSDAKKQAGYFGAFGVRLAGWEPRRATAAPAGTLAEASAKASAEASSEGKRAGDLGAFVEFPDAR